MPRGSQPFAVIRHLAGAFMFATASFATLAQDGDLILGISEGTSGGTDHGRVIAKYGPLADTMGRTLKQKVVVVFVREFAQLDEGMRSGRFDFVMARPSDYPARGMRDHGYRYLAHARPNGQCLLVVKAASPYQKLADLKGKRWVFPEQAAYMTRFCRAELRDQGIDLAKENVTHVREQASIPTYLETGFGDVGGLASYSGAAKNAEKSGLRVVHRSREQPYFPLVAGKRVSTVQVAAIQKDLAALPESEAGREVLKQIGIQGFTTDGAPAMGALLAWIEKP